MSMNPLRTLTIFVVFVLASLSSTAQSTGQSTLQSKELLAPVAWLAGCWSADGREPGSVEHWLAPAGGTMLGVSRTVKGGKTIASEFMQLASNSDGKLVFTAHPSGQNEASFVLANVTDNKVTFENPQHDFPQRIIYRRLSAKQMIARIEGLRAGTLRAVDFPMSRISCEER